jgi:hypothetical protein
MKRLLLVACILAFLAALPASHLALACHGPASKVSICHVNSANGVGFDATTGAQVFFGRVINISENAVAAHLAHGDSLSYYGPFDEAERDLLEVQYGIKLPNANCSFEPLNE